MTQRSLSLSSCVIKIRGARTHNLQGVDLDLPCHRLIGLCGVSGSGKSSLAVDTIYADGATTGRMMVLHLHPWIIGQPWRIRHLDEVLGHICRRQGVWKATGSEIIDWFKAHSAKWSKSDV